MSDTPRTATRGRAGRRAPTARPRPRTTGRSRAAGAARRELRQGPRPEGQRPAGRRVTPGTAVVAAVGVAVLLAVVLVAVTAAGGRGGRAGTGAVPTRTTASAEVLGLVTSVSQAEADRIGVPDGVAAPKVLTGQAPLTFAGRPGALYVGAEFCPYCAADMWPMIVAFSRFGTFRGLSFTTSSAWDVHPSTATFSFFGSTYRSDYIDFQTVESAGNDTTGPGTHRPLQATTAQQAELWQTYGTRLSGSRSFPFLDIGNHVFLAGSTYDPSLLSGLDQQAIAARLADPGDPVARAVIGSANYLTAAICSATGGQPADVCAAPSTVTAAKALGLS